MITRLHASGQTAGWQQALAGAITDPAELIRRLRLGPQWLPGAQRAARLFPLRVPESYLARMRIGDPADPLLRQVLPLDDELHEQPGFVRDPVGDLDASIHPGLIQKYAGRALVISTGACAVHCRYCFRRHFPYSAAAGRGPWEATLDWLKRNTHVDEIILSGGDPLTLGDARLAGMMADLENLGHVRTLRLHTRLPVVLPERVDAHLLDWLGGSRLERVMVIHANHAQELDGQTRAALGRLKDAGVRLFNQSVLLRGVNDDSRTLEDLSRSLFGAGVQPCYLHMLDPVQGAAHFAVAEPEATAIMRDLAARLPGYLLPRLVREVPGADAKQPVTISDRRP